MTSEVTVPPPGTGRAPLVKIAPVIAEAERIAERVRREMPTHPGLASLADCVVTAALEAQTVSQNLRRPVGLHRLPIVFVATALIGLGWLLFHELFRVSVLKIGLSDRDAVKLRTQLDRRVQFRRVETRGSSDSLQRLIRGEVDIAVVQGGIEPSAAPAGGGDWPSIPLPGDELVLLFARPKSQPNQLRRILTSMEGQGSHVVAQALVRCWATTAQVTYVHDWQRLVQDPSYVVPADVDGVLVVKDPTSAELDGVAAKLDRAGLQLVSPYVGAHALRMRFLQETTIKTGYLSPGAGLPATDVQSYSVLTRLYLQPRLDHNQLAAVKHLVRDQADQISGGFEPTLEKTSELLQGVEAALGILVYIGLGFLAVLSLDVYTYQNRFSELNSLVSLITMHQSSRSAIQTTAKPRAEEVAYLRVCSDLLGLIGVITGYYTQQNTSLMYNRLLEVIHNRSSSMKLNIQLKILHALIDLPAPLLDAMEPNIHHHGVLSTGVDDKTEDFGGR